MDTRSVEAGMGREGAGIADIGRVSVTDYGAGLRSGAYGAQATVSALLARIDKANPTFDAYTYVDADGALAAARAIDACVRAGIDLGPLMGVPVAVKDLYAVTGFPMTAGSRVDIAARAPAEGWIVRQLKRGGAILLGKTRTTEFAFGAFNPSHPTPRNPCDRAVHRMPGGSSAGSAVAQAAGLCQVAFGTDTGGSVRQPAALCGVAGFKPTAGRLPMDGVFPLSHTFDSPGWFGERVADLASVWEALSGEPATPVRSIDTLVLGRPERHFFDDLETDVAQAIDAAEKRLVAAGAKIVPLALPSLAELDVAFGAFLAAELVAYLGRERVESGLPQMDPVAAARITPGLALGADAYVALCRRFGDLARAARIAIEGVDAVLTPACPRVAAPVDAHREPVAAAAWSRQTLRLTRPANLFGWCAIALPVGHLAGSLPVGLQLLARGGDDARLLSIAATVETLVGSTTR